jgi:hypothetical protein
MEYSLQEIVDNLSLCGGNKAKAAEMMQLPASTLKDKVRRAQEVGVTPNIYPKDIEAKINSIRQEYEDKLTALRRVQREEAREEYTAESVREFFFGLNSHTTTPPKWTLSTKRQGNSPGEPTLILSDFHWGEVVDPDQVGGVNNYNIELAEARLKTTIDNTIDICFNHMVSPKYRGIVLCLGGDMFSGDIHDELSQTNETPVLQSMLGLFDNLVTAITHLADSFDRVFIVTTYGNHGRATNSNWYKNAAFMNYDWVLYNMLEHHFKLNKDDRVRFQITNSYDSVYSLAGTNYLLTHGDRAGGGGGGGVIGSMGPVLRGIKKLRAQYASLNLNIDYVLMGHWHQLLWLKDGIVNGSLKGYDEFAMGIRAEPEAPQQALWFTHPERSVTFRLPIFSENKPKAKIEQSWVSWL